MKILADTYRKNGYDFRKVERIENVAVFAQVDRESGRTVAYEVFIVQSHNGREIGGTVVAPAEFVPSNEQWGTLGFTVWTPEQAADKMKTLLRKEAEKKAKREAA